ncbi:RNA 3'-terminal phosphate cyclase [Methanocaldococcus indicus]|uniref:RNA 3'-terminal phosphate cyclase n=1 Tax=Methanocaldococcus indicus TaxID=213231 RepID=UPI003C6D66D6
MTMIEIDGSYLEGGGQIVRTAIALSALTMKPIKIFNIRKKRKNKGLSYQHVACVKAVKKLCNADVEGLYVGSEELIFIPKKLSPKNFKINIGTAGAVTLVIQSLLPLSLGIDKSFEVKIIGGTDVKNAPTVDYTKYITLKILSRFGVNSELKLIRRGFYPEGGGEVIFKLKPSNIQKIDLVYHSKSKDVYGVSYVQNLKEDIARRMRKKAVDLLNKNKLNPNIKIEVSKGLSTGAGIFLCNDTIGSSYLGEKGLRAEIVAERCVNFLLEERNSNMALDRYMGDQIIPFLAFGKGKVGVSKITNHTKTNMWVVKHFLDVDFKIIEIDNGYIIEVT